MVLVSYRFKYLISYVSITLSDVSKKAQNESERNAALRVSFPADKNVLGVTGWSIVICIAGQSVSGTCLAPIREYSDKL